MDRRVFLTKTAIAGLGIGFIRSSAAAEIPTKKPNILFCIADDATYAHFGAYGCDWVKTPGFDRVAKNGILFNRAYTPNAKCAPSRACILTGRNTWQLKEACNHIPFFPPEFKTYAEALGEHFVPQVALRGSDHAAVERHRLVATDPTELAVLESSQQLGLQHQ